MRKFNHQTFFGTKSLIGIGGWGGGEQFREGGSQFSHLDFFELYFEHHLAVLYCIKMELFGGLSLGGKIWLFSNSGSVLIRGGVTCPAHVVQCDASKKRSNFRRQGPPLLRALGDVAQGEI